MGVFGSTLSNEYLLLANAFNLSRGGLLELCSRAIESVFGGEEEKGRLRRMVAQMKATEEGH